MTKEIQLTVKPFRIDVPQYMLDGLQRTRWPAVISGQNYGGPEITNTKELAKKALRFDWCKKETELIKLPHFTTEIDGQTIHSHPCEIQGGECHAAYADPQLQYCQKY